MTDTLAFLRELPPRFESLRSFLEANLQPYIKIQVGEEVGSFGGAKPTGDPLTVWQSKIGGNPYFPKDLEYPIDPGSGKAMPLLMQINCADVPQIPGFDFPQQGILQFYLGYEPADADGVPDKYRVLYFPEVCDDESRLISNFSFIEDYLTIRELYGEIYPIEFVGSRDLFWESRSGDLNIPEEFAELFEAFYGWISDCNCENYTGMRGNKLGGYVDFHSNTNEIAEYANGNLLLELYHPSCTDDSFLFFIPDDRLGDRDFSEVEFHFVCD
jgi:uncharacterized protein YwqG